MQTNRHTPVHIHAMAHKHTLTNSRTELPGNHQQIKERMNEREREREEMICDVSTKYLTLE